MLAGYILTFVLGYLIGSFPTGYVVASARGVDIRSVGSGNIGATNVFRILGRPAGSLVLFVDALKGWLAVVILAPVVYRILGLSPDSQEREFFQIIAGLAVVLGHNYTCWLKFKGGKGIATSAGVLIALVPWALLIILTVWIITFFLTRYVSLASILASATLPFATWLTTGSLTLVAVTSLMSVLAIYKHRSNMQRLLSGTESRVKPKEASR